MILFKYVYNVDTPFVIHFR